METPERTELRRLDDSYDLLDEIRREPSMVTWLGRHRALGRDVSITVYRAGPATDQRELTHLAADARLLSSARRDGVVPVVESRWLSHEALAIVRARVRGATLRHVLDEKGPLAPDRAADVLRQVGSSLEWARRQGVVHRTLSSDTVCFLQGSGRVVLSFAAVPATEGDVASSWHHPPAGVGTSDAAERAADEAILLDRCSDAQTLGMLGWEMLTGRRPTGAMVAGGAREALARLRPDVPAELAEIVENALVCQTGGRDVELPRLLARLAALVPAAAEGGAHASSGEAGAWPLPMGAGKPGGRGVGADWRDAGATGAAGAAGAASAPPPGIAVGASIPPEAWRPAPAGVQRPGAAAVASPERPRARQLATAGIGLMVLSLIVLFFVMSGDGGDSDAPARATAAKTAQTAAPPVSDTATVGGEVAFGGDELTTPGGSTSSGQAPGGAPSSPAGSPSAPAAGASPRQPAASAPASPSPPAAAAPAPTGAGGLAACSSPAPSDQRTCLHAHLAVSDVELNRAYLQLIAELRQQAGVAPGVDPPSVQRLRAEQRRWLQQRDAECLRKAGNEGAIWAPSRASCLGQISGRRANELWRQVEQVRQGG